MRTYPDPHGPETLAAGTTMALDRTDSLGSESAPAHTAPADSAPVDTGLPNIDPA